MAKRSKKAQQEVSALAETGLTKFGDDTAKAQGVTVSQLRWALGGADPAQQAQQEAPAQEAPAQEALTAEGLRGALGATPLAEIPAQQAQREAPAQEKPQKFSLYHDCTPELNAARSAAALREAESLFVAVLGCLEIDWIRKACEKDAGVWKQHCAGALLMGTAWAIPNAIAASVIQVYARL